MLMSRRNFLLTASMLAAAAALPRFATAATPVRVHVLKDPNCGCCTDWIDVMRDAGFDVTAQDMPNAALAQVKAQNGITPELASCHTANVEGYVIEGHVPPADIRRLLATRPDAVGLSVPGMPYGSPGMGPETAREAYDVVLVGRNADVSVFAHYPAA